MRSGFSRSRATLACPADFHDRLNERSFPAERFDVMYVPEVVDVRDQGDVCICSDREAQLVCDGFLEPDEGVHVGTCGREHIVAPEDYPHMKLVIPYNTLDELEAGAVVKFFVNDRVPRDRDRPPAVWRVLQFLYDIRDLVDVHVLPGRAEPLTPVKKPAMVIVFER